MKSWRTLFVLVALFSAPGPAVCQEGKLVASPDIIPPATAEMQRPDYWISRLDDPDRIIMTPRQISELNRRNSTRSLETTDVAGNPYSLSRLAERGYQGLQFHRVDPLTLRAAPGDSVRDGVEKGVAYIEKRELWDRRHIPFSDRMKRTIIDRMNTAGIPDTVTPKTAVVVRHTLVRRVPSSLLAYGDQYGWLDMFQIGAFETGTPLAVYHESRDGDWYYVKDYFLFGWIRAGDVAFGDAEEIGRFSDPDRFVVALGHRVPVHADGNPGIWMTDFYQGAKLPLVGEGDGFSVLVPVRSPDGSLATARGRLRPDADVHVGYQPFTQRNVLETIFRLMYRPYGWGDSAHERDCCGIIRTVYNTFGIFTPRAPTHQFHHADHVLVFPEDTPKEQKYRYLAACEPGITLCGFGGHIMMYLGEVDGDHFVVHSNGYSYHDEEGTEVRVARTSVTDLELEGGSDVRRFTEIATYKP